MTAGQLGVTLCEATMQFCSERAWRAYSDARSACAAAGIREGSVMGMGESGTWRRNRVLLALCTSTRDVLREEIARMISAGELEVSGIEQSANQENQRQTIPLHRSQGATPNFQDNSLTVDGRKFVDIRVRLCEQKIDNPASIRLTVSSPETAIEARDAKPVEADIKLPPRKRGGRPRMSDEIRQEMIRRHKSGKLEDSMERESEVLAKWWRAKEPEKHAWRPPTIRNNLSKLYNKLADRNRCP